MYKTVINLGDDEVIQFETPEATVEYNGARINIAVMITNKRIIFLQDINKNTILEIFNITRGCYIPPTYESIKEISRNEIKDYKYIENGTEIVTKDKNIFIFNYDVTEILSN